MTAFFGHIGRIYPRHINDLEVSPPFCGCSVLFVNICSVNILRSGRWASTWAGSTQLTAARAGQLCPYEQPDWDNDDRPYCGKIDCLFYAPEVHIMYLTVYS